MPRLKRNGPGRRRVALSDLNICERLSLETGLLVLDPRRTRWRTLDEVRATWLDVRDEVLADTPTRPDGSPLWAVAVFDEGMTHEAYLAARGVR